MYLCLLYIYTHHIYIYGRVIMQVHFKTNHTIHVVMLPSVLIPKTRMLALSSRHLKNLQYVMKLLQENTPVFRN